MANSISIEIDCEMYNQAKEKVDDIQVFIEEQLTLLINDDFSDEYEVLSELNEKFEEIRELEDKLVSLREKRNEKIDDTLLFEDAMTTIMRIHENLGMIGKNQIKQIAKYNHLPYVSLLKFVQREGLVVVNYTGVSKK